MKLIIRGKEIALYKLVAFFELEPIHIVNGRSISFAIKLFKEAEADELFFFKVYRYEFFRLSSSPLHGTSNAESNLSDEELLVEDSKFTFPELRFKRLEDALEDALGRIADTFDSDRFALVES